MTSTNTVPVTTDAVVEGSTTPMPAARFNINFMAIRKLVAYFSMVCCLLSIATLGFKGLHYGLDFTGGVVLELEYHQDANIDEIRQQMKDSQYEGAVVIPYGSVKNVLIRLPPQNADAQFTEKVLATLGGADKLHVKRTDIVGAQVGDDLKGQAILAVVIAMFAVLIYVTVRFEKKFATGAVVGLLHDILVILGLFSFFGWDFDLTVLAAILAIIGYSLNDSIVVADRIRENFRKMRHLNAEQMVDYSINQTLDRTILTSLTVWLVVLALYLVGGEALRGFSLALLIGVFVGTYSSIYVATNVALTMNVTREDFIPARVETEADHDLSADMP